MIYTNNDLISSSVQRIAFQLTYVWIFMLCFCSVATTDFTLFALIFFWFLFFINKYILVQSIYDKKQPNPPKIATTGFQWLPIPLNGHNSVISSSNLMISVSIPRFWGQGTHWNNFQYLWAIYSLWNWCYDLQLSTYSWWTHAFVHRIRFIACNCFCTPPPAP